MPSMRLLQIPNEHYSGLMKFMELSDDSAKQLIEALEHVPPKLWPGDFIDEVATRVEIPVTDVVAMVDVLASLYLTRARLDMSTSDFAELILETVDHSDANKLISDDEKREIFRNRLRALLGFDQSLGVTAKAVDLQTQHEHTFHDARLFTDLRPVFGSDAEKGPTAGLIIHKLKLSYHQDNQVKDFYLAMDSSDINRLRLLLDRAALKEQSLKTLLEGASVTILETEEDR